MGQEYSNDPEQYRNDAIKFYQDNQALNPKPPEVPKPLETPENNQTQPPPPSGPGKYSGGSFQDWFMGAVAGKPYNQQTLLNLEGLLGESGSKLTGANASGERTKIWDPTINDWVRVGFGEGRPVWIPQGWGTGGQPAAAPQAPAAPPPPDPAIKQRQDELYNMLLGRAKQGTAIDRNDPNIRQQVDPYEAAQERARRNYLADAAESLGPLANLRGEQRVSMERAGQATGAFEGQLIGRELESRRAEIQHALDSMGNMLSEQQRINLQKELSYLNDATQRYGIDTNAGLDRERIGLGYTELDWRRDPRNPANWNID